MTSRIGRAGIRAALAGFALALVACQAVADIEEIRLSASAASPLCEMYCDEVTQKCKGEFAVYSSKRQCRAVCELLPPGDEGDQDGNTVGCRLNQILGVASGEPSSCAESGPGGAGTCGDNCESYCGLMSKACVKESYLTYWTGDVERCTSACRALRDLGQELESTEPQYSALGLASRDHDGDTVQCRLFHVAAASESEFTAAEHCWHASIYPIVKEEDDEMRNPCLQPKASDDMPAVPSCDDYCRIVSAACSGEHRVYEHIEQCEASCQLGFTPGTLDDNRMPIAAMKQDTLGCRLSHAYQALVSDTTADRVEQCAIASVSGNEECGGRCDVFCSQLERSCGPMPAYDCKTDCRDNLRDRMTPYSLANASDGEHPYACRLKAMIEARAASSADVKSDKCQAAIGAAGSDCS